MIFLFVCMIHSLDSPSLVIDPSLMTPVMFSCLRRNGLRHSLDHSIPIKNVLLIPMLINSDQC